MGKPALWFTGRHTPRRSADARARDQVIRAAVQANIGELRATLRAGGGLLWCCLGGLAVYPQPCPYGHTDPGSAAGS
jgi:hypothetical protein